MRLGATTTRAAASANDQETDAGHWRAERRSRNVEARAAAVSNIDRMVVLHGAYGMPRLVATAPSRGGIRLVCQLMLAPGDSAPPRAGETTPRNGQPATRD